MRKETVLKYTFEENQFYFTNRIDSALNKKTRKAKKKRDEKGYLLRLLVHLTNGQLN